MITLPLTETRHNFIAGQRCNASGPEFASTFPATGETIAVIESAGGDDIERAIAAARTAQETWAQWQPEERAQVLLKAARLLRDNNDELAFLETLDTGRPLSE
ncbi:MAG: aldehyde dehydrogenase family protein, partial [Pseudomonadota bacterium]